MGNIGIESISKTDCFCIFFSCPEPDIRISVEIISVFCNWKLPEIIFFRTPKNITNHPTAQTIVADIIQGCKFVFLVPQIIKKKHNPQKTACANKELLTTGSSIFLYIIVLDEEDFSFR